MLPERVWRYECRSGSEDAAWRYVEQGTTIFKAARLFRERQTGDYEFDVSIAAVDANEDVEMAETMIVAIESILLS